MTYNYIGDIEFIIEYFYDDDKYIIFSSEITQNISFSFIREISKYIRL